MVSGAGSADGMGGSALVERERELERIFLPLLRGLYRAGLMWPRRDLVWCCAPLFFSVSETLVVPASGVRITIFFFTFRYMLQFLWYFLLFWLFPLRIVLRVVWCVAVLYESC